MTKKAPRAKKTKGVVGKNSTRTNFVSFTGSEEADASSVRQFFGKGKDELEKELNEQLKNAFAGDSKLKAILFDSNEKQELYIFENGKLKKYSKGYKGKLKEAFKRPFSEMTISAHGEIDDSESARLAHLFQQI